MVIGTIQTAIEIDKAARASERAMIIEALNELRYEPRDSMDTSYLFKQDGVNDAIELIQGRSQ